MRTGIIFKPTGRFFFKSTPFELVLSRVHLLPDTQFYLNSR